MKDKLTMLMILDGFGENKNKDGKIFKRKLERRNRKFKTRKNYLQNTNIYSKSDKQKK